MEPQLHAYADIVLLLEIGMGLALIIGAVLARKKMFRLHACCQSTIVLLNLAIVVLLMVPSFQVHVSPKLPAKLGKAYYALATAHAALGSATEMAGLYIVLAAGTNILPQQLRLTRYKAWMRSVLVLWWLVILLGLMTYVRWYVPQNHATVVSTMTVENRLCSWLKRTVIRRKPLLLSPEEVTSITYSPFYLAPQMNRLRQRDRL